MRKRRNATRGRLQSRGCRPAGQQGCRPAPAAETAHIPSRTLRSGTAAPQREAERAGALRKHRY
ncbi:hypothetical protein PICMEDRAFT_139846 [Pichia membranifaciens NRRL Y-2026]|uniref:Uncharacterized protein n=1 Tax=Pichia membranifaciens NRRL Y-2026 TaxID=763406 RepID=A0A1E3NLM8_9ASCO|nr:hypothetical protein PICMEDRAFT_139846 [Pichia membranifaciens NRRL Y-2026]ODQ46976.1 hypothetical protein PICMEDRAFT_139846 [Pichia membranifaciens NRRL Y-2026]